MKTELEACLMRGLEERLKRITREELDSSIARIVERASYFNGKVCSVPLETILDRIIEQASDLRKHIKEQLGK